MANAVAISGFISRSNLATPLDDLPILVDPYWGIMGDDADAADMSMQAGVMPGQSATKYVWADSPYVAGQQLVLATPDITTLDLRVMIDGDSMLDAQTKIVPIVQAIRDQLSYTVSVTFDEAVYTWSCWSGDYLIAMNQLFLFGYLVPMYLTLPRDPTPAMGPI
jgi:hypothetical protein